MDTKISLVEAKASPESFTHEYKPVVISKADSQEAYGIAVRDDIYPNALCIKEIGTDKELVLSIVDTLNKYRVPSVHFLDVVSDLMNEQY